MTITILSPHRDDAAFSLGLTIERWLNMGHVVEVVNCFTESEYAPSAPSQTPAGSRQQWITELRRQEDLRWSRSYARPVSLTDLHLDDAPQRLGCTFDQVCDRGVDPEDAAITQICRSLHGRAVKCLLLPLAVGDHVDHQTARVAGQSGWPETLPIAFYEDLPYAARPGGVEQIDTHILQAGLELQPTYVGQPTDASDATETKRRLMSTYESQIDPQMIEQISRFCARYGGRERLWANPAWFLSGPEAAQ